MIHWDVSPVILDLGPLQLRWYGTLFALGFVGCLMLGHRIARLEKTSPEIFDRLLVWIVAGTIIGARLAHCLFYDPDYYLRNPLQILFVWQGGLASHGGTIGIIFAVIWFTKKNKVPLAWVMDRVAITVPIAATCVRLGNLMNSEIYGKPTDVPWAFVFYRIPELPTPRHPTQLYEAITYALIGLSIWWIYRRGWFAKSLSATGYLLATVFATRILLEFTKVNQESFDMGLPLNMGQLLSVPFVAVGIFLMLRKTRTSS